MWRIQKLMQILWYMYCPLLISPLKVCNIGLLSLFMFVDFAPCFLFASLLCWSLCWIVDLGCLAESCVEIKGTAVCFELLYKLLNADGVHFICYCDNFGVHPVILLFVKIFPNLEVCAYISRSFHTLKYAHIYCLACLEKRLILFVVNTLMTCSLAPQTWSYLSPFPLQRNPTIKILGASPSILDLLSCKQFTVTFQHLVNK